MAEYDIYGQALKHGHCEVHPEVGMPYPCPMCRVDIESQRVIYSPEPVWSGEENPRIEEYDGKLDDFLASDVQAVHFEATDQSQWCAIVTMRDGEVWQLKFGATNVCAKGHASAERIEQ